MAVLLQSKYRQVETEALLLLAPKRALPHPFQSKRSQNSKSNDKYSQGVPNEMFNFDCLRGGSACLPVSDKSTGVSNSGQGEACSIWL
jgi:hypothetical protein